MTEAVYVLCSLTSLACFLLLGRSYLRSRARLLLWSSLCFLMLTANSMLLFLDKVIFRASDLSLPRDLTAIAAIVLMIYGLIWESD